MSSHGISEEVERLLITHFPRDFWIKALDELPAAYGSAYTAVKSQLELHAHEAVRALPQVRHYTLSSSMRKIGMTCGLEVLDLQADHSGENYVILRSGALQLGRIGVNQGSSLPRGAKHRALIAALNARLEGVTYDMFSHGIRRLPSNTLGLLIVNVNPKQNLSQDRMIDLQVGVPFADLSGWHYLQPCSEIIAKYADLSSTEKDSAQIDKAVVRLKKIIVDIEEQASREKL